MYFESLQAAIMMDGHGAFVWSAYGLTGFVLVALLVAPWRRRRRLLLQIRGQLRREQVAAAAKPRSEEVSNASGA